MRSHFRISPSELVTGAGHEDQNMKSAADKIAAGLGDAIAFANGEKGRGSECFHRAADHIGAASASAPSSDRLSRTLGSFRDRRTSA
jgi:hypothetical protein